MKYLILTLFLAFSYQQTSISQISCTRNVCSFYYKNCFEGNVTGCKDYGTQAMTECGVETLDTLYSQIFSGKDYTAPPTPAALTDSEQCLLTKADTEFLCFKNFVNCLKNCTEIEPEDNSFIGLFYTFTEIAPAEFEACITDTECSGNLSAIKSTEMCQKCNFLPQTFFNWNMPLTYGDAQCFIECYSSNNTENVKLKELLDASINMLDGIEFKEDQQNNMDDNVHKKFFEMIIAFFMKLFSWFFK